VDNPRTAARPNPWVVIPRPNPSARLRLFCFPYAGGGASIYAPWTRLLPPWVEVVAAQLPGRESRVGEKPISDMGELVPALARALVPLMDRPFAFFGHSNGGLMAFELARLLRREGRPAPLYLFVSGRPAPQLALKGPVVHLLAEDEFRDTLRRFNGTPAEVLANEEIMELITPMLRADFALGETYRYTPEPPLDIPITSYGGQGDEEVETETVEAWDAQTSGAFRVMMLSGGHFFINENRDQVVGDVTRELQTTLSRLGLLGYA
jgi:medium-chain acyl-[acyl-carrier-protein] hydrolase